MNEFELIKVLTGGLPVNSSVVKGPGDDCAVLDLGLADQFVLFKTDAVVQSVHFDGTALPRLIGRKALGRCLSDIAAAGGNPVSAVITLALPAGFDAAQVMGIYEGIKEMAGEYTVSVVGGETTTNPGGILISVSMIGTINKRRYPGRGGAKVGDAIFISGTLGGSRSGKHLDFVPRVREGKWLVENFEIHAMMDISDGLAGDLPHILEASRVGADLNGDSIPISKEAKLAAREIEGGKPPLLAALTDGEDFELLFTVAARDAVPVLDGWKAAFPDVPITCIGRVSEKPGLRLKDQNGVKTLNPHGYVHFK